jgi:hypothetical protein
MELGFVNLAGGVEGLQVGLFNQCARLHGL